MQLTCMAGRRLTWLCCACMQKGRALGRGRGGFWAGAQRAAAHAAARGQQRRQPAGVLRLRQRAQRHQPAGRRRAAGQRGQQVPCYRLLSA